MTKPAAANRAEHTAARCGKLPPMNDLALGAILLMLGAAPLSLLALAFTDLIRLPAVLRSGWATATCAVLSLPALVWLGQSVWGWAGAAHLGPLCAAYGSPDYRPIDPLDVRVAALDLRGDAVPPWAKALTAPSGPLDRYVLAGAAPVTLQVRRVTHHENRWFKVQMDRFRVIDETYGTVRAEGDELWIEAGWRIWRCGLESGPKATDESRYPGGDGIARFVERALRGPASARS